MSRSIGRYLVELLTDNGIDTVFGIPGVHNLELYRGLAASDIRHVLVRHEHRVQSSDVLADCGQTLRNLAPAQARVDQQARAPGRDEHRVPGAAAR